MRKMLLVITVVLMVLVFPISAFAADTETKANSILAETDIKANSILNGATEYNGNYYLLIEENYTWEQAKIYCEGLGGHLATITSQGEDEMCYQLWKKSAKSKESCWLGATDSSLEGVWKWVTDEAWSYSNWGGSEPNGGTKENALQYYYKSYPNGEWNDSTSDGEYSFICEWEHEDIAYIEKTYAYITSSSMIFNNAFYYNGNVYKVFQYDMSYNDAKAYCKQLGGHLATITSQAEDKAVFSYVSKIGNFNCMLGGSDAENEGLWTWVTGELFSYANWADGEPNNQKDEDFLQYTDTGKWNDIKWKNCFLCEWEDCCVLHSLGEAQITKAATCTAVGEAKMICSKCGAEFYEEIEMKPHDFLDWETEIEATCHSDGKQTRACKTCGFSEERVVETLTHKWGEWFVSTPATCHAPGLNERTCTLCGDREQETTEQLVHEYGEYVVVSGNIVIPPIVKEKTCKLCNDVQTYKDWSNIWITILIGVALIGVIIGVVNYIKALKKH